MKKGLAAILVVAGMVIGSALTLVLSPVGAAGALVGAVGAPNSGHESLLQQALDTLVGNGTITQKQAGAVTNQVQTLEKQHPQGLHRFGGPGGHGGFAALGPGLDPIGALATKLKTDPQTLMGELRSGKSIADVAKEKGVDLKSLEASLVADAQTQLDQAVKNGWLTQQQADTLKSKLAGEIDELVNRKWDQAFGWHGGPGFGPAAPGLPGSGTTVPLGPSAPTPATPPSTSAPSTTAPSTTAPSTTVPSTTPTTA